MFNTKRPEDASFMGVAMALIILGAGIFALGVVCWILNLGWDYSFVSPSTKVMGGAIIGALGYVVLELELLRKK